MMPLRHHVFYGVQGPARSTGARRETDRADLVEYGVTHHALEAATSRMCWLGEGLDRPAGYAHRSAGIV